MHRLNLISMRRILAYTNIAVIAISYWILYSRSPLELHLATLCLAGMVVALTLEIALAYKQHQLQAQKDPNPS